MGLFVILVLVLGANLLVYIFGHLALKRSSFDYLIPLFTLVTCFVTLVLIIAMVFVAQKGMKEGGGVLIIKDDVLQYMIPVFGGDATLVSSIHAQGFRIR